MAATNLPAKIEENSPDKLPTRQYKCVDPFRVFNLHRKNPNLTLRQLADILQVSHTTIKDVLAEYDINLVSLAAWKEDRADWYDHIESVILRYHGTKAKITIGMGEGILLKN